MVAARRPWVRAARPARRSRRAWLPHLEAPLHIAGGHRRRLRAALAAARARRSDRRLRLLSHRRAGTGLARGAGASAEPRSCFANILCRRASHEHSKAYDGSSPQRTPGRGHDPGGADRAHRAGALVRPETSARCRRSRPACPRAPRAACRWISPPVGRPQSPRRGAASQAAPVRRRSRAGCARREHAATSGANGHAGTAPPADTGEPAAASAAQRRDAQGPERGASAA